jgi:hypothetical protein
VRRAPGIPALHRRRRRAADRDLGLVANSVESASNLPMFLMLLPFLGSGFVPTDSMDAGLRWFAEHQPFRPINETLRGLLRGTHRQRRHRRARLVRRHHRQLRVVAAALRPWAAQLVDERCGASW